MDAAETLERLRSLGARVDEAKAELENIEGLPWEGRQGISQNLTAARARIEWSQARVELVLRTRRQEQHKAASA